MSILQFASRKKGPKSPHWTARQKELKETIELYKSKGAAIFANAFDASDLCHSKEFVSATVEHYQSVDILVNLSIAIKTPHSFLDHTRRTLGIS